MPAGDEAPATRKHRVCPTQTSAHRRLQRTCSHCSKLSSRSCEQCRTSAPIASSPIEVYAASNTWAVGAHRWCSRGRPASGEQLRCAAQLAQHSAARACSRAQRSASRCMTWSLSPSTCAIRRVLSRRSWQEIWSKAYGQLAHSMKCRSSEGQWCIALGRAVRPTAARTPFNTCIHRGRGTACVAHRVDCGVGEQLALAQVEATQASARHCAGIPWEGIRYIAIAHPLRAGLCKRSAAPSGREPHLLLFERLHRRHEGIGRRTGFSDSSAAP
jgi:hypothetical protein